MYYFNLSFTAFAAEIRLEKNSTVDSQNNALDYWDGNVDWSGDRSRCFALHQILIMFSTTCTAAFAIINLVFFLLPSNPVYFGAVSQVLGKTNSNTMMVVLNSRMVYGITNNTVSNELSVVTFGVSEFFISLVHGQRSDLPLEDFKTVSVTIQTLISILNLCLGDIFERTRRQHGDRA